MSDWAEVFLGVIAVSSLVTSIMVVVMLGALVSLARRVTRLVERVEQEVKPALDHVNAIARDAARAASLATAQVERIDRVVGDLVGTVEQAVGAVRDFVAGPMRKGGPASAAMSAFWAVVSAFRDARGGRSHAHPEEDDGLFI